MSKKIINQLLGIEPFENNRISTIYLAINGARFFTNNNLFIQKYENDNFKNILTDKGLNYEFLFSGLLNYLIFIEQIGSLFGKGENSIINCLDKFFPNEFSNDEKNCIKEFRNCFAHRYGLATQKKTNSNKFCLIYGKTKTIRAIEIPKGKNKWNGDFSEKSEDTDTIINVSNFIKLCEELYNRIINENKSNGLKLEIDVQEVFTRYTIIQ